MKVQYEIVISVDVGALLPSVHALMNGINDHLSSAGCDEKLSVRSKMIRATLTSEKELNEKDREKVKQTFLSVCSERCPEWNMKVESFRRKSGNVQQSVSQ